MRDDDTAGDRPPDGTADQHQTEATSADGDEEGAFGDDPPDRCSFCQMRIPEEPIEATLDGTPFLFCSNACRDAMERTDQPFTEYHGHQRVMPGVSGLDASLPQGFPRNAFVLVSGEAGTRDRALGAELIWRTLQRGEPVVFVSFQEPPAAVVQQFLTLDWNVLPYLEQGQFHIVDCFTYRLDDRQRMFDRMDAWNGHLNDVAAAATTTVRDPTDVSEIHNKIDNALEERDMVDNGVVLIDSLTELGTLVQPVQAYNFVKDIRADVCKGRFVPILAGATIRAGGADTFPHDLSYVVDGLVELRLNEELVEGTLIKEVRIRKLNGVLVIPEWHAYEYTSGIGMVTFDPREEMEKDQPAGQQSQSAPDSQTEESTSDRPTDETTGEAETAGDASGSPAEETMNDDGATANRNDGARDSSDG